MGEIPKHLIGKGFKKKDPRAGRPKGSKNKFTNLRDAFIGSFVDLGGQNGLTKWAKGSRNRIHFNRMIAQMLPKEIQLTGKDGSPIIPPKVIFEINGTTNSEDIHAGESPKSPEPEKPV